MVLSIARGAGRDQCLPSRRLARYLAAGAGTALLIFASNANAQDAAPAPAAAAPTATVVATAAAPPASSFPAQFSNNSLGAFVTTDFGVREGFALFTIPNFPLSGTSSFNLSLAGLKQDFDLGVKILPWLGVFADGDGSVVIGTSVSSLALGPNAFSFFGEGGAVARLFRLESTGTQVSLRASGGGGPGIGLNIEPLIQNLESSAKATVGSVIQGNIGKFLLTPESTYAFGGSLNAAQALTRNFGAQFTFAVKDTGLTQSPFNAMTHTNVSSSLNTPEIDVALAVSIDGSPNRVPIALVPEYELLKDFGSNSSLQNLVAIGLYYSGRRDLQVGLEGAIDFGLPEIEGSGRPSLYLGEFLLRYYW
jgi:hypothetical protein